MTTEQPQPISAADVSPRNALALSGVVSLFGALILVFLHMTVRLYSAISSNWNTNFDWYALVGGLGLLSVVPILSGVLLGHVGVLATRPGKKRGRGMAAAGLALGYVLFVLYLNRVLIIIVTISTQGLQWTEFPRYFLWWA